MASPSTSKTWFIGIDDTTDVVATVDSFWGIDAESTQS
jgi:hypothetical protein